MECITDTILTFTLAFSMVITILTGILWRVFGTQYAYKRLGGTGLGISLGFKDIFIGMAAITYLVYVLFHLNNFVG